MSSVDRFIEANEEELYERYADMYPEEINSDWTIIDNYDKVADFVEEYLMDEVQRFVIKGQVFIQPRFAKLYNQLVKHETYMSESYEELTLLSYYRGKHYKVTATRVDDIYVVTSILEEDEELVY